MSSQTVAKFIDTFQINLKGSDKTEVFHKLEMHMDAVCYNVASIAIIFALLKGDKKIQPKHLQNVMGYISSMCSSSAKGQKGGMSMASDYFGYPHPNYASSNAGSGVVMSEIEFNSGIARAGIDSQIGGTQSSSNNVRLVATNDKDAKAFVKSVVKMHNIEISKTAFTELMRIIDIHLNCLATDLSTLSPLTVSKVDKVLGLKRHAVFH